MTRLAAAAAALLLAAVVVGVARAQDEVAAEFSDEQCLAAPRTTPNQGRGLYFSQSEPKVWITVLVPSKLSTSPFARRLRLSRPGRR